MKSGLLLCVSAVLLAVQSLQAYSYLGVNNPHTNGWGYGTIEEATVAMRPNGAFMKYDVTMTFSARNQLVFAQTESLEVSYRFSLPVGAVVNDLYLWVGSEISRGLILDRSTASATYENIVKRRRDPAFLQKTSPTQYLLQIYPMAAAGTRTVRFTYLAPIGRTADTWYASVPGELFTTNGVPLQSLRVIYYSPSQSFTPTFLNAPSIAFTSWTDTVAQTNAWKCDIPNAVFTTTDVQASVPVEKGKDFIVTCHADTNGGTYHVMLDPFSLLGVSTARKFIVAFDHDSAKTSVTRAAYIDAITTMLRANCTANDSFNVAFNSKQRAGEGWFAADSAGIASAFRQFGAEAIPDSSDIPGLFTNVIEFLNMRGPAAGIILMAASDKLNSPTAADSVLRWLDEKLPKGIPVHVVKFMNRNFVYEEYKAPDGGTRYSGGNLYFYDAIKTLTHGTVQAPDYDGSLTRQWAEIVKLVRGGLTALDVQVHFENGFTYSKYSYGIAPFQTVYPGQMAGQIGRVLGTGPVSFDVSGFYDGRLYHKKVLVADAQIQQADSSLRAVWAAKYITDIEWNISQYSDPDLVKAITSACMAERVVCRFTALLALEPGDTLVKTMNDQGTGPVVTGTKEQSVPAVYSIAQAYPNPFNPSTTLRVQLPEGVRAQDVTLRIYNMLGQLVRTFDPAGLTSTAYKEFIWDATDNGGHRVASGMYLFVVSTPNARHTVKLMLLK